MQPLPDSPRKPHTRESGYALLFVFLIVATIGIAMMAAMPRVAFESQRDQEELLIDRGEQYKRAIQLYVRKFKKYPGKIDDLEDTNGQRFLRQRYIDPITGKDEWRLIHIGGAGQFTDSLTQKPDKKKGTAATSVNNFITELQGVGGSSDTLTTQKGIGMRRRPSDPAGMAVGSPLSGNGTTTFDPTNPNAGAGLDSNSAAGMSDLAGDGNALNNNNAAMGNTTLGNGGMGNAGVAAGQSAAGSDVIRNILTSPRPGGPPPGIVGGDTINDVGFINGQGNTSTALNNATDPFGNTNSTGSTTGFGTNSVGTNVQNVGAGSTLGTSIGANSAGGLTVGGGIAGVASKSTREGIKVYKEHQKYNEWEFLYDQSKDTSMGGLQAQQNMINAQRNQAAATAMGTADAASSTPAVGVGSPAISQPQLTVQPNPFRPQPSNPVQAPLPFQPPVSQTPTPVTPTVPDPSETAPQDPVEQPAPVEQPVEQPTPQPPDDSAQPNPAPVEDPTNPQ